MYARVIVDIAHEAVDRVFSYRVPDGMELCAGMRVQVPFGHQFKEGYVLGLSGTVPVEESRVKAVIAPLEDYPALLPQMLELAEEIKKNTHCPLAEALRLMLPAEMRGGRIKIKTEACVRLIISGEELQRALSECKNARKRRLLLEMLSDGKLQPVSEISC